MVDYEQLVLSVLISDPNVKNEISLSEKDFFVPQNQIIYRVLSEMVDEGEPVDLFLLSERLHSLGLSDKAGGFSYLSSMLSAGASKTNIIPYAAIVKRQSIARRLVSKGNQISQVLSTPGDAGDKIAEAEQILSEILDGQIPTSAINIEAATRGAIEFVEKQLENSGKDYPHPFGFVELDDMTCGASDGDLVVIAGRPSMGKTSFAMNTIEKQAANGGAGLVVSIEMSAAQLALRMISSIGRIDGQKLRKATMDDDDWGRLTFAVGTINSFKIEIDETPGATPASIRRSAKQAKKKHGRLDFIVIDYLQLMNGDKSKYDSRTAEIGDISRSLKLLAKELGVPIYLLSQLNRSLEQRQNKRPVMSDLRESGAIEQDADIILFIYRDEVYNPDSPEIGCAEIIVGKQRNGPIGSVRLAFKGEATRFEDFRRDGGL